MRKFILFLFFWLFWIDFFIIFVFVYSLIFSDMSYYIKQFKNLNGLHLIKLNLEDVWSLNTNTINALTISNNNGNNNHVSTSSVTW